MSATPMPGTVATALSAEFPGLRLRWLSVPGGARPSPPALRALLGALSNRFRGASVVAMRTHPIPSAYRAFFRQVGLDPDTTRVPSEAVALQRLLHGGLRSHDLVTDALTLAVVETGVGVWALDAALLAPGGLEIRLSGPEERLGDQALAPGRLVVADAARLHGLLFGELAPGHAPNRGTERVVLFAIGVDGVPEIHLEEALWVAGEAIEGSGERVRRPEDG